MIIHLAHTCSIFEYLDKINVKDYKTDQKTKGNAIIVIFNKKEITIPLSNVIAIEET